MCLGIDRIRSSGCRQSKAKGAQLERRHLAHARHGLRFARSRHVSGDRERLLDLGLAHREKGQEAVLLSAGGMTFCWFSGPTNGTWGLAETPKRGQPRFVAFPGFGLGSGRKCLGVDLGRARGRGRACARAACEATNCTRPMRHPSGASGYLTLFVADKKGTWKANQCAPEFCGARFRG